MWLWLGNDFLTVCLFLCRPAHAKHGTDVNTVDNTRCSSLTDERQRLSGDRSQTYGYCHVEQCLSNKQQSQSHYQECGESVLTSPCYSSGSEEKYDVEECHYCSAFNTHLLYDDGIDEVGESLRQEVALFRVARSLADDVRRGYGNVGMSYLGVLIEVVLLRRNLLCRDEFLDSGLPCVGTVECLFNDSRFFRLRLSGLFREVGLAVGSVSFVGISEQKNHCQTKDGYCSDDS